MPELGSPYWLLAIPPVVFAIWWLHRRQHAEPYAIAALFLWQRAADRQQGGIQVARRADRAWLIRAAIAALLLAALAEPAWRASQGGLVVWVDDSLSMQASAANGASRLELSAQRLQAALAETQHSPVTLRALGNPGASLALRGTVSNWPRQIADWAASLVPREPAFPAAVELDPRATHWLVTDAAAPGIGDWLAAVPISRVITVGDPAANVAITRLAARSSPADPGRWSAMIEIVNTDSAAADRRLRLVADGEERTAWSLSLAPGEHRQIGIDLPDGVGSIVAELERGDALAADDALALDLPRLRVPIAIRGSCGPSLSRALRAHPRLLPGAPDPVALVVCGDEPATTALPTLRLHAGEPVASSSTATPAWSADAAPLSELFLDPAWLTPIDSEAPPGMPWLYLGNRALMILETGRAPILHVLFDIEKPAFTAAPEYAVFIARLLGAIAPALGLDPIATASRPAAASMLAPLPLPPATRSGPVTVSSVPLVAPLLTAALVLLVLDIVLRLRQSRGRSPMRSERTAVTLESAVAVGLATALLVPNLTGAVSPRDLVVIGDDSASMALAPPESAWPRLADLARHLPGDSRISVVRFAADNSIDANRSAQALKALADGTSPPPVEAIDRSGTDLGAALLTGLRLVDPERPTALVLVSDGHLDDAAAESAQSLLERAARVGLPVYSLARPLEPPVEIRIHAPAHALAGTPAPIDVTVLSRDDRRGRLSLSLAGEPAVDADLELTVQTPTTVRFALDAPAGTREFRVEWRDADGGVARAGALEVEGAAPWLALSLDPESPALRALRAGGWTLTGARPESFATFADRLDDFAGIVLDDLAIWDLPASAWTAIGRQITGHGSSLLVLGGPRSFGAGGYRHSTLEQWLPVTAEARNPRDATALLFVLDVSGSMGRSLTEDDPMAYARRAILESAAGLGARDEVGLIAFDVEPRHVLDLGHYADPAAALENSFASLGPDGGTRLRAALAAALSELSATEVSRKLLVLVTDGFIGEEELSSQLQAIEARGIDLIALAIGRDADRIALRDLVDDDHLYRVERVSELPRLMHSEVEKRRQPIDSSESPVRIVNALPGDSGPASLPPVSGHTLAMARPDATVYVETAAGDPLLAADYAGAGRTAVLLAGLGAWAESWTQSADWPALAGSLENWLRDRPGDTHTQIAVADEGARLAIAIDATARDDAWSDETGMPVVIVDPLQRSSSLSLPRVAPGRYAGLVDAPVPGRYVVSAQRDSRGARETHFRSTARELDSVQSPSMLPAWLEAGLLRQAPGRARDWQFSDAARSGRMSPWFLALLLAGYGAALIVPYRARGGRA